MRAALNISKPWLQRSDTMITAILKIIILSHKYNCSNLKKNFLTNFMNMRLNLTLTFSYHKVKYNYFNNQITTKTLGHIFLILNLYNIIAQRSQVFLQKLSPSCWFWSRAAGTLITSRKVQVRVSFTRVHPSRKNSLTVTYFPVSQIVRLCHSNLNLDNCNKLILQQIQKINKHLVCLETITKEERERENEFQSLTSLPLFIPVCPLSRDRCLPENPNDKRKQKKKATMMIGSHRFVTRKYVLRQINDDELQVISEKTSTTTKSSSKNSPITIDGVIPLKTQQRNQRFKKMLILQSQEIDTTIGELKTKVLKLVQLANGRPQHDEDLLTSAELCTKRFHRAMRKALVELSQINDRLVRDYLHWRKRSVKSGEKKKRWVFTVFCFVLFFSLFARSTLNCLQTAMIRCW